MKCSTFDNNTVERIKKYIVDNILTLVCVLFMDSLVQFSSVQFIFSQYTVF